eukprot:c24251_g7_i1 orf=534-1586(+)
MAAVFSSWETDPFYAAAADIQESADRMESAYRNWLNRRALAGEESADERSINFHNQEVTTALDTTKWQLEEFEKAVTDLAQRNTTLLGDDVSKRHFSFIGAIRSQIGLIEGMLHKCMDIRLLNTLHSGKLDAKERDQLEMFLSGCASFPLEKENGSLFTSSKVYAPVSGMKKSMDPRLASSHHNSRVFGVSSDSSSKKCAGDGCKFELQSCLEIVKTSSVPSEKPNTIKLLQEEVNGVGKLGRTTNGFRRWKKGYNHMDTNKEAATLLWKDKPRPDIEEGVFPEFSRSNSQRFLRGTIRWNLQRFAIPFNKAACSSVCRRVAVLVVVLCLCCMYFWFLSSLVPYVNNAIP